jgi:hypothetical protein
MSSKPKRGDEFLFPTCIQMLVLGSINELNTRSGTQNAPAIRRSGNFPWMTKS